MISRKIPSNFARLALATVAVSALLGANVYATQTHENEMRFVQISAKTKEERSKIANLGISIEAVRTGSVWGFAHPQGIQKARQAGLEILGNFDIEVARGGHENLFGFPPEDDRFHTYEELTQELQNLQKQNPSLTAVQSIGKSIEGRDIWAFHINTSPEDLKNAKSNKPGIIFMGNHHAREHVSLEIPLMLIQHLLKNQQDAALKPLLESRDIWIIPMVNPDGAEFDISSNRYKWWRKNRRDNKDGTFGVDLNRNYGYKWGTGGSDTDTSSDIYMGTAPFSEPETQAIKNFVTSQKNNTKVLLSFHTFSELILYPWGHTYEKIQKKNPQGVSDYEVYEKMAKTMAGWNHYTPEQASDLYIASGDTTDWAYGELGIFSFTFELSPSSMWSGGFYPGAKVLDRVFQDNLRPCLYLIEKADNPYRVMNESEQPGTEDLFSDLLKNYVMQPIATEFARF
jgi:carboxypeptidase T